MTTAKRILSVFLTLPLLLLIACTAPANEPQSTHAEGGAQSEIITLRIVDMDEENTALLAGETGDIYRSKLPEAAAPYCAGMLLDIEFSGEVLELYPAQLSDIRGVTVHEDQFDDRCALYLSVLEDIWAEDPGLNGDTKYVGVDLSSTALTESEQAAVAWRIGELTQKELVAGTFDELCAAGYIDRESLYWADGCLLAIEESETSEKRVTFRVLKWRSGLGAIFYENCTAKRDQNGNWSNYELGSFAIS